MFNEAKHLNGLIMSVRVGNKEQYSLKPFLLDAILGWCQVNQLTPILVTMNHPGRVLPEHLKGCPDELSFNVSPKAVFDKVISTDGLVFSTYFRHCAMPQRISLPAASWRAVRVKETNQYFDLAFPEQFLQNFVHWPLGVHLSDPQMLAPPQTQQTLTGQPNRSDARSDERPEPSPSSRPQAASHHVASRGVSGRGSEGEAPITPKQVAPKQGAAIDGVHAGQNHQHGKSKKPILSLVWNRDQHEKNDQVDPDQLRPLSNQDPPKDGLG